MDRFEGKIALVTGGGSGIGRVTALRFAAEGADVTVVDRDEARAKRVAAEIENSGRRAVALQADVSHPEDCERMAADTVAAFGRLNVLFANAGVGGVRTPLIELDVADWDHLMNTNLRGMFLTCKFAGPAMIESGGGAMVLMGSSTGGWDTIRGSGPYMASKEAVKGLARNLALELAGYRIRVNAICPGIIQTGLSFRQGSDDPQAEARFFERFANRIPLRRVGQPEDVAAAVAFLASDDARHITGSSLLIDGGQTLQSWSNAPDDDAFPLY